MLYQILLAVGGLGLLAQAVLGFAHSDGNGGHDGHGGHGGHAGHSDHIHTHVHEGYSWLLLLSPLRLFSFSLGVGGAGLALQSAKNLPSWLVLVLALLMGWALYQWMIRPLMVLVLRFASKPATNLAGTLGQEATADSRFDESGKGIVTLVVDGHLMRLLATLEGAPQPVEAGERLTILDIDTRRNRVKVSKK